MTDEARFSAAIAAADQSCGGSGIGTLGQRTLHAVLKHYFEPDTSRHEVRIGRYVADIAGPEGIIEIQTRQLDKLRGKLEAFLPLGPVTVVYPLAHIRWLAWVDPATGEVSPQRKSPKTGRPSDALAELGRLRDFIGNENLRVRLLLIDMAEYKLLNGYGPARKKGATRCERIPRALAEVIALDSPADYARLLPPGLPARFTTAEFDRAARLRGMNAWHGKQLLLQAGVITPCGKAGRSILYERGDTE